MSNYTDLKDLEEDGEERGALRNIIAAALNEAAESGISQIKIVYHYSRLIQAAGRFDNPRPGLHIKASASTADADRLIDRIVGNMKQSFGRGFVGRIVVGVENPERGGEPLSGVYDRNIQYGDPEDNPYGLTGGQAPPGMGLAHQGGGGGWGPPPHHGGGGHHGGGQPGGWSMGPGRPGMGGGGHGPSMGMGGAEMHGPPGQGIPGGMGGGFSMDGFAANPPSMVGGFDPGPMGQFNDPADRELVRSVIAGGERRLDILTGELRARDENFFRMLDYNLRQNHQFMQMLGMVFGRWVPPAQAPPQASGGMFGPLLGGLLATFFPSMAGLFNPQPPQQPQGGPGHAPSPPEITGPPPHRQAFYEPMGDPTDLSFGPGPGPNGPAWAGGSFHGDGSFDPHAHAQAAWRPPQNEEEWTEAMQSDPSGAKKAAAKLVPAPFNKLLDPGAGEHGPPSNT